MITIQYNVLRTSRIGALALVIALWCGATSLGTVIGFDPDGAALTNGSSQVATFDFLPGNSLFKGIGDLTLDEANRPFTQYIQARLGSLKRSNNSVISTPGLNGVPAVNNEFEITVVAGVSEKANLSGGVVTYAFDGASSSLVNYFELWYDDIGGGGTKADDLAGTGFADGVKILSGTITAATGVLSYYDNSPTLDNFINDDYPGTSSLAVVGGQQLSIHIDFALASFFTTYLPPNLKVELFNQSTVAPFDQVDPSALFWNGASNFASGIGAVNGLGPNFQVQSDANSSFVAVPEPSSIVLAFFGLMGVAMVASRRSRKSL